MTTLTFDYQTKFNRTASDIVAAKSLYKQNQILFAQGVITKTRLDASKASYEILVGSLQDIEKQKIKTNEQIISFQRNYWGLLEKQYSSPSFYIENFEEFKVDGRFSLRSPLMVTFTISI